MLSAWLNVAAESLGAAEQLETENSQPTPQRCSFSSHQSPRSYPTRASSVQWPLGQHPRSLPERMGGGGSDTSSGSHGRQSQHVCSHFLLQTENWRNTLLGQNKYIWHLSCACTSTFTALELKTVLNLIYTKVSFHHFGSRKRLSLCKYYIFFSTCVSEDQAFAGLKIDVNDPSCCHSGVERPSCNRKKKTKKISPILLSYHAPFT